ncbi:hypothetical protein OC861_005501 [Tilletia horrida]|nr:hypothetical protein OC861_005501 [Tilletia horrida]
MSRQETNKSVLASLADPTDNATEAINAIRAAEPVLLKADAFPVPSFRSEFFSNNDEDENAAADPAHGQQHRTTEFEQSQADAAEVYLRISAAASSQPPYQSTSDVAQHLRSGLSVGDEGTGAAADVDKVFTAKAMTT